MTYQLLVYFYNNTARGWLWFEHLEKNKTKQKQTERRLVLPIREGKQKISWWRKLGQDNLLLARSRKKKKTSFHFRFLATPHRSFVHYTGASVLTAEKWLKCDSPRRCETSVSPRPWSMMGQKKKTTQQTILRLWFRPIRSPFFTQLQQKIWKGNTAEQKRKTEENDFFCDFPPHRACVSLSCVHFLSANVHFQ